MLWSVSGVSVRVSWAPLAVQRLICVSAKRSPKKEGVWWKSVFFAGSSLCRYFLHGTCTESLFVLSSYELLFRGYYSSASTPVSVDVHVVIDGSTWHQALGQNRQTDHKIIIRHLLEPDQYIGWLVLLAHLGLSQIYYGLQIIVIIYHYRQ